MRHSRQRAREGRRAGARLNQSASAGTLTSIQSDMVRLQRLVGNAVVANLIAGAGIQRRTDSTGGGSSVGVRNEATFPSSLDVLGSLVSLGETTVGGSAIATSMSARDTLDVGGRVTVNGPAHVRLISAPVIVHAGQPSKSKSSDASDRADRAFDDGEAVPSSGFSAGEPAAISRFSTGEEATRSGFSTGDAAASSGFSAGDPAASSGFSTGDAAASSGFSTGDAAATTSTADDEQPVPEVASSFATLLVRKSLTVAGNLAAGSARLGSPTTIGGTLQVGALHAGTLRAGGTVVLNGPVNDDVVDTAPIIIGNQVKAGAGSRASSPGTDDSDNSSD